MMGRLFSLQFVGLHPAEMKGISVFWNCHISQQNPIPVASFVLYVFLSPDTGQNAQLSQESKFKIRLSAIK